MGQESGNSLVRGRGYLLVSMGVSLKAAARAEVIARLDWGRIPFQVPLRG